MSKKNPNNQLIKHEKCHSIIQILHNNNKEQNVSQNEPNKLFKFHLMDISISQ